VNFLLDTHIALWAIADDARLPEKARLWMLDRQNTIWVSAVSIWEIAIKHRLGREFMPLSGTQALDYFEKSGYKMLAITPQHTAYVDNLPSIHQDPFDRLLVAQAATEPLRLLTHDQVLAKYNDSVIVV
jgi:PIN domain nuclease of toxin-antitoxin system